MVKTSKKASIRPCKKKNQPEGGKSQTQDRENGMVEGAGRGSRGGRSQCDGGKEMRGKKRF